MKKSTICALLLSYPLLFSCSSREKKQHASLAKIASAVKASSAFSGSDLEDFNHLDTLFITAQELPKYRILLEDIAHYDSILNDAKKVKTGKPVDDLHSSIESKVDINGFIETTEQIQDGKRSSLTALIDNATDTMYKVECTEHMKSDGKVILTTHATVYLNSFLEVIDYRH